MVWIPLTSPSGHKQYFNADNIVVFRELSALEAAKGAHSKIWLQTGTAQVGENPDDILKLIQEGLVKLTATNDRPLFLTQPLAQKSVISSGQLKIQRMSPQKPR